MSKLTFIRDEVYLRIATKKAASSFYFANDFVLEKTWRPWERLQDLFDEKQFPSGKVYVIGGRPGDMNTMSRTNMVQREYPVHVGFQCAYKRLDDVDEGDRYVGFVEELEETLRLEVDSTWENIAFLRIEPLRDSNGIPFDFVLAHTDSLFQAYFTAFFSMPLPPENVATTTTSTTT